jgi:hypothetical protein
MKSNISIGGGVCDVSVLYTTWDIRHYERVSGAVGGGTMDCAR